MFWVCKVCVILKKDESRISLQIRRVIEEAEYDGRDYVVMIVILCNVALFSLVALCHHLWWTQKRWGRGRSFHQNLAEFLPNYLILCL